MSMVQPLLMNLMRSMQPNQGDATVVIRVKTAILNELQKRYTDESVRFLMLQSSATDPRFKALPFVDAVERLDIQTSLITSAESIS